MPIVSLALVLVVLIGAGLRFVQAAEPGQFLSADERAYATIGLTLADGGRYDGPGLEHPFHWPPGTPAMLAFAHELSFGADGATPATDHSGYWAQAAVGSALIAAVFALGLLLAGPWAGLAGAAATAFYPPLISVTGDLVSEPLGALTLTLALVALVWAWRRERTMAWLAAGAALGAAVLVRADLLLVPFALAGLIALAAARSRRSWAVGRRAGLYLAGALVLFGPWIAYVSARSGRLVPVSDGGGSALYVATYLPADGTIYGLKHRLDDQARASHPAAAHLDDDQIPAEWIIDTVARRDAGQSRESALQEAALHNLVRYGLGDPIDFAGMSAGKFARMWFGYDRGTHHRQRTWILIVHLLLAAAATIGLAAGVWRTRHGPLAAILLVVAVATLTNCFYVAEPRHNLRLMPILLAGGAAGWATLVRTTARQRPLPS